MSTMKKIAGAAVATLALAGALLIPATAAHAGGSDAPTPYTVTASGVQLPAGATFQAHGHINWKTTTGSYGMHFDPNNNQPGGAFIGKDFFPIQLAPGECIVWVQVSNYNEHFGEGGQAPVCAPSEEPPPFEGVTKYTPSYGATCEAATFSHPAIKTGFGIANVYGVRYGLTQADAQAKPFEPYTPGTVVTMPFADPYVDSSYYFELKVGYDGAALTHQIGQTRGLATACERPVPEQPAPLTGEEVRDLEPVCTVPADGTAEVVTERRAWSQGHVWNAETWTWDLVEAPEFTKWETADSQVIDLEECAAVVPPAIDPPTDTPAPLPTKPVSVQTAALATTGDGSLAPLGLVGLTLVALGLGFTAARLVRSSIRRVEQ